MTDLRDKIAAVALDAINAVHKQGATRTGYAIAATDAMLAAIPDAEAQAAEIARLRLALKTINETDRIYGVTPQSNGAQVWHNGLCGVIARVALEVKNV